MESKNKQYGICGVYCGQCPNGNGRVKAMAKELKRLVDTTRYDWLTDYAKSFKYVDFRKGLEWFANEQCPMCLNHGGNPSCPNRKCAPEKKHKSCLQCNEYLTCDNTRYQREWYPFVTDSYTRVKQVGLEKHLDEEEARAKAGVDLMSHLERRCCKTVKLEEK